MTDRRDTIVRTDGTRAITDIDGNVIEELGHVDDVDLWDPAPPWEVPPEVEPDVRAHDGDEDPAFQLAYVKALAQRRRAVDGATFILEAPTEVPALWGRGEEVLAAQGEPTLIVGPTGIGKTTLAQRLVVARIGIGQPTLLGLPVARAKGRVLYIAADRPRQAQRSLARMVSEEHRKVLAERLEVWRGPPPFDLAKTPQGLVALAEMFDASDVILDSLKDVAMDLSTDETGSRLNNAIQIAIAEGIEVIGLHHQRKPQGGVKPKTLNDVYGSVWIPNGSGSVVLLWGEAGDPVIEVSHLKQPAEIVGPFTVLHEQKTGTLTRLESIDAFTLLRVAPDGMTAPEVAVGVTAKTAPDRNDVEKARRQLERLVATGYAHRTDGAKGGAGGGVATRYYAITSHEESAT